MPGDCTVLGAAWQPGMHSQECGRGRPASRDSLCTECRREWPLEGQITDDLAGWGHCHSRSGVGGSIVKRAEVPSGSCKLVFLFGEGPYGTEDWEEYLRDRAAKGFSALQYLDTEFRGCGGSAVGHCAYSGHDRVQVDPAFFQWLDPRVEAINEHGFLAVPLLLHAGGDTDLHPGHALDVDQLIVLGRCACFSRVPACYRTPYRERTRRMHPGTRPSFPAQHQGAALGPATDEGNEDAEGQRVASRCSKGRRGTTPTGNSWCRWRQVAPPADAPAGSAATAVAALPVRRMPARPRAVALALPAAVRPGGVRP